MCQHLVTIKSRLSRLRYFFKSVVHNLQAAAHPLLWYRTTSSNDLETNRQLFKRLAAVQQVVKHLYKFNPVLMALLGRPVRLRRFVTHRLISRVARYAPAAAYPRGGYYPLAAEKSLLFLELPTPAYADVEIRDGNAVRNPQTDFAAQC